MLSEELLLQGVRDAASGGTPTEQLIAALRRLEAPAEFLDNFYDAVVACDMNGVIASWNRGAERLFGYSAAEAVGRFAWFVWAPESLPILRAKDWSKLFNTGFDEIHTVALTKQGVRRHIHGRTSRLTDANGVMIGTVTVTVDVTELTEARAQLADRERQLREILDVMPVLVTRIDAEGRYTYFNKAHAEMHGVSEDILGRRVLDVMPQYAEHLRSGTDATLRGERTFLETEIKPAEGPMARVSITRIPDVAADGSVCGYYTIATDVTEAHQLTEARLADERRLRETLLSELQHRIKNTLQGVVGLLRSRMTGSADLSDAILPALVQLQAVAASFGLVHSRGIGNAELVTMVHEITRNLQQMMSCRIHVEVDPSSGEPIDVGSRHTVSVALVINELVFNALKHGRPTQNDAGVRVYLTSSDTVVTMTVVNLGGPLPAGFDLAHDTGAGTGLRLARLLIPSALGTMTLETDREWVVATLSLNRLQLAADDSGRT